MIKYPNELNISDVIGITATSSGANLEKIDKAIENVSKLGYKVIETQSTRKSEKLVSADAKTRAEEFIQLWKNDDVKLILEARGGEFLIETIPYIKEYFDKEKLYKNPKWVQGFSDVTTLNFFLTTNYNIATSESNNLSTYAMDNLHESLLNSFKAISDKQDFIQKNYEYFEPKDYQEDLTYEFGLTERTNINVLNQTMNADKIEFSGRLIGGCLDCVSMYVHTKWDNVQNFINQFEDEGIIWHLENCELSATEIYRRLYLMKQAGWFKNVKGFIFGRSLNCAEYGDFYYIDAIEKALLELNVPIIYDLDIGHLPPRWTIINGSLGKIEYENGNCKLTQKFI